MLFHGHSPVAVPLAVLHDPCMQSPQGRGEVSSADADRVPWTPKRKAGVGDGGEGHPGCLRAGMREVSRKTISGKPCCPSSLWFHVLSGCWCSPQANADPSVISCLHNLSRRIAIVLQHEERRCQYLTREAKLILAIQDEVSAMSESECLSSSASVQEHCLRELLIVPSCFSRAWDHCE